MTFIDWKQQYETEKARLLESLGELTEGGIVEAIQRKYVHSLIKLVIAA